MERRPFARLLRCARQAVDTRDHQDVTLAEKVHDDEHATMSSWSVLLSIVWLGDIGNWEIEPRATLTAIAEAILLLAR